MRCVSYTRTFSCLPESEIPEDIIIQQNERIKKFIKQKKWTLIKKYSDRKKDELDDSAFMQMKQDAIERKFDCVVVDSMFRCGRNTNVAAEIFRNMFIPAKVFFAVAEDDFCSSEVSQDEAFAYLEEKVKEYRCYTVNVDMRKFCESKQFPKYGYRYKSGKMELEIDPEASKHVQRIFQLICEGKSFKETAEIMTDEGVMSSGRYIDKMWGRKVDNPKEAWKRDQIKRIIYNRLYVGEWTRTINGEKRVFSCPPLVTNEIFEQANHRDVFHPKLDNLGKTPLNPFSNRIYDKDTGISLKLFTNHRLQARVFRISHGAKERVKYKKGHILYDEVYQKVYAQLLKEQKSAEYISKMIDTDVWIIEKQKQIEDVRKSALDIYHKMVALEEEMLCLYKESEAGQIDWETYQRIKNEKIMDSMNMDALLQKQTERMEQVEKAFSKKNPWMCLFGFLTVPDELKREHIKLWIDRIDVVQYEYLEMRFKEHEWKEFFPFAWLEEVNDGS